MPPPPPTNTHTAQMMVHAWRNYVRYAWGYDELDPLRERGSSSPIFGFANIGATIVDSLDTLHVMRMVKEFKAAREWVANQLNFNQVCVCTYVCVCVLCASRCVWREHVCWDTVRAYACVLM